MYRFHALQSNFPKDFSRKFSSVKIPMERPKPRLTQVFQGRWMRRERAGRRLVFSRFIIKPKNDWQIGNVTEKSPETDF